jgi:transcriptional regulator with XRE-family HTH domain
MKSTIPHIEQDAENLRANVARLLATRKLQAVAHGLGVERATVARWRAGSRKIDSGYLPSLARYFRVSIDDLFAPVEES